MSKAIILQHVAHETPGRIVPILRDFGIPVETRKLFAGDEVPTDAEDIRLLVVLGGPAHLPGDIETDPALGKEVELLKKMIERDQPVLGICLGAQLLALAGGAKVYPNVKPGGGPNDTPIPLPELGWGPIKLPFPGGTDPLLMGLRDGSMMFHWHYDTFDLPRLQHPNPPAPPAPPPPTGSVLMASTAKCKNQAFRFKNRLVGFQFHFEFTQADIEAVAAHATDSDKQVLGGTYGDVLKQQTAENYPAYARLGDRLMRNFVQFMRIY